MNYASIKLFVFGEVLFDIFGGEKKLGGAPFNVAYNLQMQGLNPQLISRVGTDGLGAEILAFMNKSGMSTSLVKTDSSYDTGRVIVKLTNGEPEYDIRRHAAYDRITCDADTSDAFIYYGTLAARETESKKTLLNILNSKNIKTFYDVNLRSGNWTHDLVSELAHYANCIKLNLDELNLLTAECSGGTAEKCRYLIDKYGIAEVYVTCGADGALFSDGSRVTASRRFIVEDMHDTVGAGDAFSSVIIKGLINGADREQSLNMASMYAAKICSIQGALTKDKKFYIDIKEEMDAVFK
jgi:fructokinase